MPCFVREQAASRCSHNITILCTPQANVDGEHNIGLDWTLEYLKKLEIVFQQGTLFLAGCAA
jgi:hypothetical protein